MARQNKIRAADHHAWRHLTAADAVVVNACRSLYTIHNVLKSSHELVVQVLSGNLNKGMVSCAFSDRCGFYGGLVPRCAGDFSLHCPRLHSCRQRPKDFQGTYCPRNLHHSTLHYDVSVSSCRDHRTAQHEKLED